MKFFPFTDVRRLDKTDPVYKKAQPSSVVDGHAFVRS